MGFKTSKFAVMRDARGRVTSFARTGGKFAAMTGYYNHSVMVGGIIDSTTSASTADKIQHSTEVCTTLSSSKLNQARAYCGTLNPGSGVAYTCGGNTQGQTFPNGTNSIEKLNLTDDTSSQISASVSRTPAQWAYQGYTGNQKGKGYLFGGSSTSSDWYNIANNMAYSTETMGSGPSSMQQSQSRYGYGVVSDVYNAISAGGWASTSAFVVTADKHDLATENAAAQSSANLSLAGSYPSSGAHSDVAGYFLGRYNGGSAYTTTMDKLVFSTLTTSALSNTLFVGALGLNCGSNETHAFLMGFYTSAGLTNTLGKFTFETELSSQLSSILSASRSIGSVAGGVTW